MLVAWAKGKRRSKREYEDEVVSAIFGPLLFASEHERYLIFKQILISCGIKVPEIQAKSRCELKFWPNIAKRGRVEPDLVVKFSPASDVRELLVVFEAKWDSGLSARRDSYESIRPLNQLGIQWEEARRFYHEAEIQHIYLAKNNLSDQEEKELDPGHRDCLKMLTWMGLADSIHSIKLRVGRDACFISNWADVVGGFLGRLGYVPFSGVRSVVGRECFPSSHRWSFESPLMGIDGLLYQFDQGLWFRSLRLFDGERDV